MTAKALYGKIVSGPMLVHSMQRSMTDLACVEGKHNKTAYKLAVLLETTTIECLTCTPDGLYLVHISSGDTWLITQQVAGCGDGNLRFFDFEFRVVSWNEEVDLVILTRAVADKYTQLGAGPITSVSFAAFDPSMNMADTFAAARTQSFNFLEGEKVKVQRLRCLVD